MANQSNFSRQDLKDELQALRKDIHGELERVEDSLDRSRDRREAAEESEKTAPGGDRWRDDLEEIKNTIERCCVREGSREERRENNTSDPSGKKAPVSKGMLTKALLVLVILLASVSGPIYEHLTGAKPPAWLGVFKDSIIAAAQNASRPVLVEANEEEQTVLRPIPKTVFREEEYTVRKPVTVTVMEDEEHKVMRPVTEVTWKDETYTETEPVREITMQEKRVTVRKPENYTVYRLLEEKVCEPVTEWVREYGPDGYWRSIQVTRYVERTITRRVPTEVTRYVDQIEVHKVPVETVRYEEKVKVRKVQVESVRYVEETQVRKVPVERVRFVYETRTRQVPVEVVEYVPVEGSRSVPTDSSGHDAAASAGTSTEKSGSQQKTFVTPSLESPAVPEGY